MVAATSEEMVALSTTQVIIHPLVLLSVTDHAARVAKGGSKRVVGVLLGQDLGSTLNVANSFAVPFDEEEAGPLSSSSTASQPPSWFLDHNFVEAMGEMFKKVSAKEKLIGWYHTGPKLRATDLEINEVFKRYCPRPVMVIVDVRADRGVVKGSVTDAYFAIEEIKDDGTATQNTFMHVPSSIEAEESEEIGVEHLLRDIKDLSTGTLSTRVTGRLNSLRALQARLGEISEYLEGVLGGKLPLNHQIIYNLQDIFNLLPNVDLSPSASSAANDRAKPLTVVTNDQLLVVYLSSLIRAVIALHGLVNNKLENQNSANPIEQLDHSQPNPNSTTTNPTNGPAPPNNPDANPGPDKKHPSSGNR
ncbi:26S proteasome regulatory subunit N8 [Puccinia graminis f. sp. tritici CRL 75-36-700-3]|uniref:26S proteasome regulatory subunit N8 n=1 Tax=Puccinia graminis f. sp. tritici (strain CRL 75-36-700-3 / race SCCL) TaxID=418459 RepID=E3KSN5_PUCGT|nr:26S proteasome regulatory subunit N8 [Puccinia graminis f. sp. tritici CRL 75-36-700-3]EFP87321.1 26S proteasome regulatory subunit N8 [Puccinia graminis f. sp. tritici CRL 75-36-700-3]